jgi:predicted DNA-binding transcriptional regulator AlpA
MSITAMQLALDALSLVLTNVSWKTNSPTKRVIYEAHAVLNAAIAEANHIPDATKMVVVNEAERVPLENDLLNEQEAAELLYVKPNTLSVWRSTGKYNVPFIKIGRLVRYRRSELIAWAQSRSRVISNPKLEGSSSKFHTAKGGGE